MKLIILQEKLKKGLQIIERISPKSFTLPILNTVLIKTKKNFLNLKTTDLEIGINWWALAKIEEEGELAVPISLLSNFLNFITDNQITLTKKENFLLIESEKYKTKINSFPTEDFPLIPEVSKEDCIEINSEFFCNGLAQVVDFCSFSQTKPEISGVYFLLENNTLKLVATDSFRLAEKTLFIDKLNFFSKKFDKKISFIIPQKTVREVINIFNQKEEKLKIYFSPNHIMFENQILETPHPEIQLISHLIEGEYPAYQEVIPQKFTTQVIFNRDEFLKHLRMASLFTGKINEIKFKIGLKKGIVEVFSQNPDLGEHYSFLPGIINGDPIEISFNHRFLINGISVIKSKDIIFQLNKEEKASVLRPVDDQTFLYIVMPIKHS